MLNTFYYPQQIWDYETCLKKSKSRTNMGYDAPKGYIGSHYCRTEYNGGKKIDGKVYRADCHILPQIDDAFELKFVSSWGYFIKVKDENNGNS